MQTQARFVFPPLPVPHPLIYLQKQLDTFAYANIPKDWCRQILRTFLFDPLRNIFLLLEKSLISQKLSSQH